MAFKLAIGAGHYRYTAGKRLPAELDPAETREWILNDRVVRAVIAAADQYEDVEILRVDDPDGETYVTLEHRCSAANAWAADFCLSVHHDSAGKVFSGSGITCFVCANGGKAEQYQHAIYDAAIAAGGIKGNRSEPLRVKGYDVLRWTDAPAVLIECGFMDSRIDAPIILDPAYSERVGKGIMDGIAKQAGLKRKPAPEPMTPPPAPSPAGRTGELRIPIEIRQDLSITITGDAQVVLD